MTQTSTRTGSACESSEWKGREAVRLANGVVELVSLRGGGHLASFRLLDHEGRSSENVFWEAPWPSIEPVLQWTDGLSRTYGPVEIGKFLASYTGHALCLDYFGEPSEEQVLEGLSLHGEAAITKWSSTGRAPSKGVGCRWSASLPLSQLTIEREIQLIDEQSVAYVEETVINQGDNDCLCDWVQHVTFGVTFLKQTQSSLIVSAKRGITAFAYGEQSLLAPGREFDWPFAPSAARDRAVDLTQPFQVDGFGFLAGLQMDRDREQQFMLAINWSSRLGVVYCFRQSEFPWMTIWEENCTRQGVPWYGTTRARGMEFGTSPLPLGKQKIAARRTMFDRQTGCIIPGGGASQARYLMALFTIPGHVSSIQDVRLMSDFIHIFDGRGRSVLCIPASGCEAFLTPAGAKDIHK